MQWQIRGAVLLMRSRCCRLHQVGDAVTNAIPQSVKDGFEDVAARALDAVPAAEISKVPRYSPRYEIA